METMMIAGLVLNPIGLLICFLVPAIAIFLARRSELSAMRLIAGYIGALAALALVVAATSYVSPDEAVHTWHVPPQRYWSEITQLFIATYAVTAFISIFGISLVGLPVLVKLSSSGIATAPWFILLSVAISTAAAFLLYALMHSSSNITFLGVIAFLVGTHAVLATGFALAARLPWAPRHEP